MIVYLSGKCCVVRTDIPVIADGGGGGSGSVTPSQDMYWLQLILIHLRISPSREGERD